VTTSEITTLDTLRQVGTLVLLVRVFDMQLRSTPHNDPLTMAELSVLGQVDRGIDLSSQLARALRLDPARVTHITDRLVTKGYLARRGDPEDRRRWRLALTEQGTERLIQGRSDTRSAMESLLEHLTDSERTGLLHGLAGMRRILDAQTKTDAVPPTEQ